MHLTAPPQLFPPVDDSPRLLALAIAGDSAGIGGLYDRHASRMLRVAWRLTGSMTDAEDVVHDVFVRLPEMLRRYEERGSLEAWLTRVTAQAALMRLRSERRRRETSLADAVAVADARRTDLAADYAELERHIAALPEALRVVLVLRQIEGFTHDEVALALGISVGASRVRLTRALEALRESLQPSRAGRAR